MATPARIGAWTVGRRASGHVLCGDVDRALALVEGERMWLDAPGLHVGRPSEPTVAVAWVMPGEQETTVVAMDDHTGPDRRDAHVLDLTRSRITSVVYAALNAAHGLDGGSSEVRRRTVEDLVGVAATVASVFPHTERLLIIPLGIAAQLPFAAACRSDGEFLIDHTCVTLAPSLAWARAAHRPRRTGRSVGIFHPGRESGHRLDLVADRATFDRLVGGTSLDRPSAARVLESFDADTAIGHFSCHGFYNVEAPWDSGLELETDLTIQAVLDHRPAPWLVNLSACETGVPDLQAAEQHISFPTGFLGAGAAHVLATLWPVDNTYATAVNESFYHRLGAGRHPADALRDAVRYVRGGSGDRASASARRPAAAADQSSGIPADHPYWWAPFTHYGSPW